MTFINLSNKERKRIHFCAIPQIVRSFQYNKLKKRQFSKKIKVIL